ncbi:MAG TPA: hypothetical protein VI821_00335 [Candidatus Paceibacterota bacterium]
MANLSSDTAHADRIKTDPINYACDIFTDVKKMVGEALEAQKNSTELKIEEILSEVQQKYIVFTRQYPLVIRLMVVEGVFNKKAFERYVRYLVTNTPKSKEDIIWGQATWIKYLYIEQTPHADRTHANKLVEDMYQQLKKEQKEDGDDEKFFTHYEKQNNENPVYGSTVVFEIPDFRDDEKFFTHYEEAIKLIAECANTINKLYDEELEKN